MHVGTCVSKSPLVACHDGVSRNNGYKRKDRHLREKEGPAGLGLYREQKCAPPPALTCPKGKLLPSPGCHGELHVGMASSVNVSSWEQAALRQLPRNKVPNMAVMIKSLTRSTMDASVVFKDPTGKEES